MILCAIMIAIMDMYDDACHVCIVKSCESCASEAVTELTLLGVFKFRALKCCLPPRKVS